jgi:putative flippase GtrA
MIDQRATEGHRLARIWRFNLVGAMGMVVQFALLAILVKLAHLPTAVATAIAVALTVAHNFAWHEQYTFADRVRHRAARTFGSIAARFLRFNLTTGAISVLGNVAFTTLLTQRARLPLLVANAVAIALCAVLNYLASDRLVFRKNFFRKKSFRKNPSRSKQPAQLPV